VCVCVCVCVGVRDVLCMFRLTCQLVSNFWMGTPSSLQRLLTLQPAFRRIYPGHGPVVEDGVGAVQQYITHRQARETQIVTALGSGSAASPLTLPTLVKRVYADLGDHLIPAATGNVCLHLHKLWQEQVVLAIADDDAEVASVDLRAIQTYRWRAKL
jgi:hypothetical protein